MFDKVDVSSNNKFSVQAGNAIQEIEVVTIKSLNLQIYLNFSLFASYEN